MGGFGKWIFGVLTLGAFVFVLGFLVFAADVVRTETAAVETADGIVVLTGGDLRVRAGLQLLDNAQAQRLLITGVNPVARKGAIARAAGVASSKLECCVDLGYEAVNTLGNATETSAWARQHGFRSLIVVTASYHMPRSMIELSRQLPGVRLTPYPVVPKGFDEREWWLDARAARVLFSEYVKLFPAAVRLAAARLFPNRGDGIESQAAGAAGRF